MELWKAKCDNCGGTTSIFPDQIELIKQRPQLALHKYVPRDGKLQVGDRWFCIECDSARKTATKCKIAYRMTGEDAKKKIDIRKRSTNLKSMGWELPSME